MKNFDRQRVVNAKRMALAVVVTASGMMLAGCARPSRVGYADERIYPQLTQDETLNVQVFRLGTTIKLTNTTAKQLPAGTLWLNRWFSREIEALEPGESVSMPLKRFVDRYGEPFRAGGFFATLDPDVVVLAQLETSDALVGLVVVENDIR